MAIIIRQRTVINQRDKRKSAKVVDVALDYDEMSKDVEEHVEDINKETCIWVED